MSGVAFTLRDSADLGREWAVPVQRVSAFVPRLRTVSFSPEKTLGGCFCNVSITGTKMSTQRGEPKQHGIAGFGFVQGDSHYTSGDPSWFSKPFFWAAAPDERYAPGRQGRKGRRVFGGARLHVDTDRSIVGRT